MNPLEHFDRLTFQQPGDVLPRPHDNCYWLLPGRIIAGEYPRNLDDETSRVKLRAILAAGVTQFIDLTEVHELEPYVELMLRDVALVVDFDDLFRHADDLGLDVRAIAAIVLATIFGGPLGEYVPLNAGPSVASLQEYAEQVTSVLGDMRRHAVNLLRALEAPPARGVFRDAAGGRIGDVLVRLARLDELLDRLRECERRIVDRLDEHRIATKRNEMERARSAQR